MEILKEIKTTRKFMLTLRKKRVENSVTHNEKRTPRGFNTHGRY